MPAQYWTCRKSVFCRNGWTNRAGFLLEKRLQVDPRDLLTRKFYFLQKQRYFPLELCPKVWTYRKFCHCNPFVATCCHISATKVDATAINSTIVGRTKLEKSCDGRRSTDELGHTIYWRWALLAMSVYVTVQCPSVRRSIRPSVCLSRRSIAPATCSGFVVARARVADIDRQLPAPRTGYRSISAASAKAAGSVSVVIRGRLVDERRLVTVSVHLWI